MFYGPVLSEQPQGMSMYSCVANNKQILQLKKCFRCYVQMKEKLHKGLLELEKPFEWDVAKFTSLIKDPLLLESEYKRFVISSGWTECAQEVYTKKECAADMKGAWYCHDMTNHDGKIDDEKFALTMACTNWYCLLYTSPSPRDLSTSRMPSSA